MGSIGRYIFRATMAAFLISLVSLTVVIWFTQAMRRLERDQRVLQRGVL